MSISQKTIQEVFLRQNGRCAISGESINIRERFWNWQAHHIYHREEYKMDDRDESWNIALLKNEYHTGLKGVHNSRHLDQKLKKEADGRKPKEKRSSQIASDEIKKQKMNKVSSEKRRSEYRRFKEQFMEKNGGKTPWSVKYEQMKQYKCKKLK